MLKRSAHIVGAVALLLLARSLHGQTGLPGASPSPQLLVQRTIANELASDRGKKRFMFRQVTKTSTGSETREVIETDDGNLDELIAVNGAPLSPEKRRQEDLRLWRLSEHPVEWRNRQQKHRREDDDTSKILQAMPDAFLYEYAGTHPGPGGNVAVLTFRPNPGFHPPSRETQVLQGMSGTMEISLASSRIVRLDARVIRGVNFGWGILGRLDPGGRIMIEQLPIGGGRWDTTRTIVDLTGKILLVKHLNIHEDVSSYGYTSVPSLSLTEAIEWLQKNPSVSPQTASLPSP